MNIAMFYHSLVSDWNHGNAHFLRGVARELLHRGHTVRVYEPSQNWSVCNLVRDHGTKAALAFHDAYPTLRSIYYEPAELVECHGRVEGMLEDVDLVLVHEWNDPEVVAAIGAHHARHNHYHLLFHDTHHRSATQPEEMGAYNLRHYDGVLAFGQVISDSYQQREWADRVWTWHEAADHEVFKPRPDAEKQADLVWVGNWGDDERTEELHEFLIEPVKRLGLKANVYGVRYPEEAITALDDAGIRYGGYLPNHQVPEVFSQHRMTVHVPRRPYVEALPGIPTIRPFEAMACGLPLICSPWDDAENLFHPGDDYLIARDGDQMADHMQYLLDHPDQAAEQARRGRETILAGHTCSHRVDQLLEITSELDAKLGRLGDMPEHEQATAPVVNA